MPLRTVLPVFVTVSVRVVVPRLKMPLSVRSELPEMVLLAVIARALVSVRGVPSPCSVPPPKLRVPVPNAESSPARRMPAVSVVVPE